MVRPSKRRRTTGGQSLDDPSVSKDGAEPSKALQASAEDSESNDDEIAEKRLRFVDVITELPNGDAAGATELALPGRGFTQVDALESCKSLRKLDFKDNHLSDLGFLEMNHQLCWLGVAKNRLERISGLANLASLAVLDVSDNRLTRLDGLSGLSSLKALIAARNRISRVEGLSPKKNPKLETLVLSNNRITECNMAPFPLLKKLSLANNQLHAFPSLTKLPQLTELRLNGNRIVSLSKDLAMLSKLSILDVGNNLLGKAEELQPLRGLLWMKSLNLFGNPIAQNMEDDLVKGILATLPRLEIVNNRRTESAHANHAKKKGRRRSSWGDQSAESVAAPQAVIEHKFGFNGKKKVFDEGSEDDAGGRTGKPGVGKSERNVARSVPGGEAGIKAKKKKRKVPKDLTSTSVGGAPKVAVDASTQLEPRRVKRKVKKVKRKRAE